jgi:hypothetical protein
MQGAQIKQISDKLAELLDLKIISYVNIFHVGDGYYHVLAEPVIDVNFRSLSYIDSDYDSLINAVNLYYDQAKSKNRFFIVSRFFYLILQAAHWAWHIVILSGLLFVIYNLLMMAYDAGLRLYDIYDILRDLF